jgi:transposase InsO family protein
MRPKQKVLVPDPSVPNPSFVKNPADKIALHRLRVLELAERLQNVAEACRNSGMARNSFYEWKRRYQTHGFEGLKDLPPVHKSHPLATPQHVRDAVLELSRSNPAWGSKRLSAELLKEGMTLSNFTVQAILNKAGLGSRHQRFLHLEDDLLKGVELPLEQVRRLERLNPCLRERHVESSRPGELVSFDTFFVGVFKGIGRVHLHTAVDTFGSYAFGALATARNSLKAAELLYGQVAPFYEACGLELGAVLTDNGTEFCGTETHSFEATLFHLGVQHRRTRVKRPQTNGFVERFHRTVLEEFFRVELRKRVFETLDDLELALQEWICRYNTDRPHQGYRNKGKPPYAIVQNHLAAQQEA